MRDQPEAFASTIRQLIARHYRAEEGDGRMLKERHVKPTRPPTAGWPVGGKAARSSGDLSVARIRGILRELAAFGLITVAERATPEMAPRGHSRAGPD